MIATVSACEVSSMSSPRSEPTATSSATPSSGPSGLSLNSGERTSWPVAIGIQQLAPIDFTSDPIDRDQRILALAAGSAELVDMLGAGGQLVGQDETSERSTDVPVVTLGHQIDIEKALDVDPTLVLVDELIGPPEAIDALKQSGADVVSVPPVWNLADVPQRVAALADSVGASDDVAAQLGSALAVSDLAPASTSPRVAFLYLRGPSAVYLLGGSDTGADALIKAAGGIDVGSDIGLKGFVPLTAEALIKADPDIVLVMTEGLASVGGVDGLVKLPGVAQTDAGAQGRVIAVDDRVLLSFGARTPSLVASLREIFGSVERE